MTAPTERHMAEQQQSFTPGPWSVEEPMDHELWIVEDGKQAFEWRVIAGCPWPNERSEIPRKQVAANARLIAAAPALLEPAEDAIEILTVAIDLWNEVYPDEPDEVFTDLQRRFQEVVAKARGKAALASAQAAK